VLKRWWIWLTTCAEAGCTLRPVHLGWCDGHAPAYDPGPDEYWGDVRGGIDDDSAERVRPAPMPRRMTNGCRR
jgi:hypothetical protein